MCYYVDVCSSCNHLVATHEYTFRVEGQYQVHTIQLSVQCAQLATLCLILLFLCCCIPRGRWHSFIILTGVIVGKEGNT